MERIEKYKKLRNARTLQTVNEMKRREEEKRRILNKNQKVLKKKEKKRIKETRERFSSTAAPEHFHSSRVNIESRSSKVLSANDQSGFDHDQEYNERREDKQKNAERESERREQEQRAERMESVRLSRRKIELNSEKKQRKEEYRRQLIEQKMLTVDSKAQKLKEYQAAVMQERFYANLSSRMKVYHLKEAMSEMVITKHWDVKRVDDIIEAYRPQLSTARSASDMKRIQREIVGLLSQNRVDARKNRTPKSAVSRSESKSN